MRARVLLGLVVVVGLLATAGAFCPVLAAIGGVLGIVLGYLQYRTTGAVVIPFTEADWIENEDGYGFTIPRNRHGLRSPTATVWMPDGHGGWQEVMCGISTRSNGDLVVSIGPKRIEGEVRIA